jgi:hypothetical protein
VRRDHAAALAHQQQESAAALAERDGEIRTLTTELESLRAALASAEQHQHQQEWTGPAAAQAEITEHALRAEIDILRTSLHDSEMRYATACGGAVCLTLRQVD